MERVCIVCGVTFNPRGPQKCCSPNCMKVNRRTQKKQYAEETREHRLAKAKEYRESNREKIKQGQRDAVSKNKDHYKKYKSKWYRENKDRISTIASEKYKETFSPKVKECCVCGVEFNCRDRRGTARTCSDICSKKIRNDWIRKNCGYNPDWERSRFCVTCGTFFIASNASQVNCGDQCLKESINSRKRNYYYKEPHKHVKDELKQQLGFTPPPELVEEATSLRLLRRAIKKAGE